jgi:uncharacterized protein (DUF2252 family)
VAKTTSDSASGAPGGTTRGARSGEPDVLHPSVDERVMRGRSARAAATRSSHAAFDVTADRPDPIGLLEQQAETRIAELVPIRYGRMLVSPFAFFRGGALIMASDLAGTPRTGLQVQLCGDAHLSNFGVFASPERRLVFDVNDFDETLPGPFEWDVKRLAASLAVAGRENGFTTGERARIVRDTARSYRRTMRRFAEVGTLEVWYARLEIESLLGQISSEVRAKDRRLVERELARARTHDSLQAFSKLTYEVNGEPRIISAPPLIAPVEELSGETEETIATIREFVRGYRTSLATDRRRLLEQYRFTHLAHKVVGVGSVGTQAWIALFLGRDNHDPLLLQVKQAQPSVLEQFLGKSEYTNHGARVVAGQRLIQASSDIFLGWQRLTEPLGNEVDFYARQLKDWKGSATVETMRPRHMAAYGRMCGWTLARAHARSGDRIAVAAYLGGSDRFDGAMVRFAEAYADQNDRDYATFTEAVKTGRITTVTDI